MARVCNTPSMQGVSWYRANTSIAKAERAILGRQPHGWSLVNIRSSVHQTSIWMIQQQREVISPEDEYTVIRYCGSSLDSNRRQPALL